MLGGPTLHQDDIRTIVQDRDAFVTFIKAIVGVIWAHATKYLNKCLSKWSLSEPTAEPSHDVTTSPDGTCNIEDEHCTKQTIANDEEFDYAFWACWFYISTIIVCFLSMYIFNVVRDFLKSPSSCLLLLLLHLLQLLFHPLPTFLLVSFLPTPSPLLHLFLVLLI